MGNTTAPRDVDKIATLRKYAAFHVIPICIFQVAKHRSLSWMSAVSLL